MDKVLYKSKQSKWITLIELIIGLISLFVVHVSQILGKEIITIVIIAIFITLNVGSGMYYRITHDEVSAESVHLYSILTNKLNVSEICNIELKHSKLIAFLNIGSIWFFPKDEHKPVVKFTLIDMNEELLAIVNEIKLKIG